MLLRLIKFGSAALALLLAVAATCAAQLGVLWPPEQLAEKSDVVAVGTPTETHDTGIKEDLTDLTPPLAVMRMETVFRILSVSKGRNLGKTLILRYYRIDRDREPRCINCGSSSVLVSAIARCVENAPSSEALAPDKSCQFKMYLKRDRDGVMVPTSGQVFPDRSVGTKLK